jgi:hypothetical protein
MGLYGRLCPIQGASRALHRSLGAAKPERLLLCGADPSSGRNLISVCKGCLSTRRAGSYAVAIAPLGRGRAIHSSAALRSSKPGGGTQCTYTIEGPQTQQASFIS